MHAFLQDLSYGLRLMRKSPGFTAVALIVLALGIGGNTAIFSVVNGVLLQPLPYPHADQLVSIRSAEPSRGIPPVVASYADYLDWKQQAHSFSNMGTYTSPAFNLSASEHPVRVEAMAATASALQTLDVAPELGRIFTPDEEQWGNRHVVLLTHSLWRDKFGADPDILGRTVRLDAEPYIVIGVMPDRFAALMPRMVGAYRISKPWVGRQYPERSGSPTVRDLRAVEVKVATGCVAAILSAEGQRVASAQRLRKNAFCLLLRRALRSATVLHPVNAKNARRRHTRFRKLGAIPSTPPPLSV